MSKRRLPKKTVIKTAKIKNKRAIPLKIKSPIKTRPIAKNSKKIVVRAPSAATTKATPAKRKIFQKNSIALIIVLLFATFFSFSKTTCVRGFFINPTEGSQQMLLVIADNWSSKTGLLERFERNSTMRNWHQIGSSIPVSLGANGLGWGRGLHGFSLTAAPKIYEGAQKSPVGVFALGPFFSTNLQEINNSKITVYQINNNLFCVDDPKSKYYNRVVNLTKVKKDWQSAEDIQKYADAGFYNQMIFIKHNYDNRVLNGGSCFFVHIAPIPSAPTQGCTALDAEQLKNIMHWLDSSKHPILVQLPKSVYNQFHYIWGLPQI